VPAADPGYPILGAFLFLRQGWETTNLTPPQRKLMAESCQLPPSSIAVTSASGSPTTLK